VEGDPAEGSRKEPEKAVGPVQTQRTLANKRARKTNGLKVGERKIYFEEKWPFTLKKKVRTRTDEGERGQKSGTPTTKRIHPLKKEMTHGGGGEFLSRRKEVCKKNQQKMCPPKFQPVGGKHK